MLTISNILASKFSIENFEACFLQVSSLYFQEILFLSNFKNLSMKSFQFLSSKNSHVFHSFIVSRSHHLL
jgi:hypothetical protein